MDKRSFKKEVILAGFLMFALILVLSCANSGSTNTDAPGPGFELKRGMAKESNTVPNEYIVTVIEQGKESVLKEVFGKYGLINIKHIRKNIYLIKLRDDPGIDAMQTEVDNNDAILRVQPNYRYKASVR